MKNKIVIVSVVLLYILQSNVFAFHPRFRDEYYIENRTNEKIVVVFENIGLLDDLLRYEYDEDITITLRMMSDGPKKIFRTIEPGEFYDIGYSQYNEEDFSKKTAEEKFTAFFQFIFIFNDNGDLLYRIDDFSKWEIEDKSPADYYGYYVLVIE